MKARSNLNWNCADKKGPGLRGKNSDSRLGCDGPATTHGLTSSSEERFRLALALAQHLDSEGCINHDWDD